MIVWWTVAVGLNAALLASALRPDGAGPLDASLFAFCVAAAARHDGLVHALSVVGIAFPGYRRHQLTYHLGQLHRAMALAGIGWLVVATVAATGDPMGRGVGAGMVVVLLAMAVTARETFRSRRHNTFEIAHRIGGWSVLAVLCALVGSRTATGVLAGGPIDGATVAPAVLLAVLVGVVAHPWVSVRRVPVQVVDVTPQIIVLALPGPRSPGEFVRVSRDGREWHSFAVSTSGLEGPDRFCLVIRRAGDWTDRLGREAAAGRAPATLLVRRLRGFGFMGHAQVYRRVLVVATGAGIGPVLPYLLDRVRPGLECLWVGRDHRASIGAGLVDRVVAAGQVTLVDTAAARPDIGVLVAARAPAVQAVFVVSNAAVRDQVAETCERLGVPWYGPTFDS